MRIIRYTDMSIEPIKIPSVHTDEKDSPPFIDFKLLSSNELEYIKNNGNIPENDYDPGTIKYLAPFRASVLGFELPDDSEGSINEVFDSLISKGFTLYAEYSKSSMCNTALEKLSKGDTENIYGYIRLHINRKSGLCEQRVNLIGAYNGEPIDIYSWESDVETINRKSERTSVDTYTNIEQ